MGERGREGEREEKYPEFTVKEKYDSNVFKLKDISVKCKKSFLILFDYINFLLYVLPPRAFTNGCGARCRSCVGVELNSMSWAAVAAAAAAHLLATKT